MANSPMGGYLADEARDRPRELRRVVWNIFAGCIGAISGLITGEALLFAITASNIYLVFLGSFFAPILGAALGCWATLRLLVALRERQTGDRRSWFLLVLWLATPPFSVGAAVILSQHFALPVADSVVVAEFQSHEMAFEQIAVQAGREKVYIDFRKLVDPSHDSRAHIERIAQYRQMSSGLNIGGIETYDKSSVIYFPIWRSESFLSNGEVKGLAYAPNPPKDLYETLDDKEKDSRAQGTIYRHIRGNWYLYLDCSVYD